MMALKVQLMTGSYFNLLGVVSTVYITPWI